MDLKKAVITAVILLIAAAQAAAKESYPSALKEWTRTGKVYVWDNMEARLIWNATYLSPDFRAARREKLDALLEWTDAELMTQVREDAEESADYDVFFLSIYAGSAAAPEVGKDDGLWRVFLDTKGATIAPVQMERLPVTQVEKVLYPHLDKWSRAYYVRFPKTLHPGDAFTLRMAGVPAKSQLVWK
ncbi:MAG TPA: hypothetical protein VLJ37_07295 [bacterium]|nr:hypothetical protein [bacterium]